jgi:hypothetical protein
MAAVGATQLVLVEVGPTPDSCVNDVGKTFASGNLVLARNDFKKHSSAVGHRKTNHVFI